MRRYLAILLLSAVVLAQNNEPYYGPKLNPEGAMFRMAYLPNSTANWKADTQEIMIDGLIVPRSCIYVDVHLDSLNLNKPPFVTTFLSGRKNHFEARGVTSIYRLSEKGFRVYIWYRNGVTPAQAKAWGWRLHWLIN